MSKKRAARPLRAAPWTEHKQAAPETQFSPDWKRHGRFLLLLWVVVFIAYSNSFESGLVFDNAPVIAQDPRIRAATADHVGQILDGGYWYGVETSGLYRPLTTLSYLVNYAVLGNGTNPAGYHWINLAIHEGNVALVYALGVAIFAEPAFALSLAALWGVHPLLTESVTNIVGRADLLAAFGVLAGLLIYARARAVKWTWLGGVAASQAVGLFSKESAIVLPALMLLYDLVWLRREKWRGLFYGASALPIAVFFLSRAASHPRFLINFPENPLIGAGFWDARMTAIAILGKFLFLFVWPAKLAADYSYNTIPVFGSGSFDDAKALLSAAICLGAIAVAIYARARWRPLTFFVGFFFIALLPTANLVLLIGSIMAERFMYLPAVGLAGCVVFGLKELSVKRPAAMRTAWAAAALLCVIFAARTFARNRDWRDGLTLWTSAIAVNPQAARSHHNLGYELQQIPGRLPEALAEYRTALRIWPDYPEAHYNLGNALLRVPGGLPEAVAEFRAAVRARPDYPAALNNLGSALLETPGGLAEAIADFRSALQLNPEDAEAHNNLGNALLAMPDRLPEAIREFQLAVQARPDYAEAHNDLGNALARTRDGAPDAIAQYEAALRIKPEYAEAHNNLANALMQYPGRIPDAIAEYRAALRIKPDYAEAHNNLGSALFQSGRLAEAIAEYQAATRLQPGLADAHYNLGNALLQSGRIADAIAEFEAVLRIKPDPEARAVLNRLRVRR